MVGKGDLWERPKSAQDIEKGNYPSMDAPFKSYKCGERGSQLTSIDNLIKNVTDTIESTWDTLTESLGNSLNINPSKIEIDQQRYKRESDLEGEWDKSDENNYACVKVVLGRTAYRSCVPKYGDIRLNCSSIIGKNVVCYCQTDDCNSASRILPFLSLLLTLLLLLF